MPAPSTMTLQEAEQAHQLADLQLKTVEAQTKAALITDHARPLLEGYDSVPHFHDEWAYTDPTTDYRRSRVRSRSLRRDRRDGRHWPAYETEVELAQMRADSRLLSVFDTIATGAVSALTNYVIGTGSEVEVTARKGVDPPKGMVAAVQIWVDQFMADNSIPGDLDREIHAQSRIDGEQVLELYGDQGHILVDCRSGDELTEPRGKRDLENWLLDTGQVPAHIVPSWSFGVLTDEARAHRPYGYHLVRDDAGLDWTYLSADRGVHIKRNVPRTAKRGVTDFLAPGPDIQGHGRLKKNVVDGSAIQAAIALVREHVGGQSKADIEAFTSANATSEYQRSKKSTTQTMQVEQLQTGTIKDIPAGMKYHAGPLGSLNHPVFLQVAQHVLRISGVNWSMPEYIVSGDASNANFSSTLVAESPFVKAREADQGFYSRKEEELIWKALRMAAAAGMLMWEWELIHAMLEVNVTLPEVASRDKLAQAQTNQILNTAGVLSLKTWQMMTDLDPDEETANGARPSGGAIMESDYRRNWGNDYP